jgi:hypothetical protein
MLRPQKKSAQTCCYPATIGFAIPVRAIEESCA